MARCSSVLFLLFAPALVAQTADDAVVPMRAERYHRLLFENSRVAVYDVVFPVGATMRFHEHPTDHLAVVIAPGTLKNEVRGAPAPLVRPPGPVAASPGWSLQRTARIAALSSSCVHAPWGKFGAAGTTAA